MEDTAYICKMHTKKSYTFQEAQLALERYCSYQERSHDEVAQKLKKMGMIPEVIQRITLSLLENNFLNEERFARSYVRGKFRIKKWGRIKITQNLRQKGISTANIKLALLEIEEQDYLQTLHELAKKKDGLIKEANTYKRKQKLIHYLYQKGYETALIYEFVLKE